MEGESQASVSLISLHTSALPAEHLAVGGLGLQNAGFGVSGLRLEVADGSPQL